MYTTCEERFLKTSKLMYMILHYFLSFLVYCTCQSKLFQHSPDAIQMTILFCTMHIHICVYFCSSAVADISSKISIWDFYCQKIDIHCLKILKQTGYRHKILKIRSNKNFTKKLRLPNILAYFFLSFFLGVLMICGVQV